MVCYGWSWSVESYGIKQNIKTKYVYRRPQAVVLIFNFQFQAKVHFCVQLSEDVWPKKCRVYSIRYGLTMEF